jgi:hypothetical protein
MNVNTIENKYKRGEKRRAKYGIRITRRERNDKSRNSDRVWGWK